MHQAQREIKEYLAPLNAVRNQRQDGESLRSTYRRLQTAITLRFNKKELREKLNDIRNLNADLEAMRYQMNEFR